MVYRVTCVMLCIGFFFRLLNSNNEVLFTCRIIHSVQVMSSVVHVFHRDKMAAVAHVIGADQLPMDSQVHFFLCFVICNYVCMANISSFLVPSIRLDLLSDFI